MPDNQYVRYFPPVLDYKKQSVAVPGTKRPGQTGNERNHSNLDSLIQKLLHSSLPEWLWSILLYKMCTERSLQHFMA